MFSATCVERQEKTSEMPEAKKDAFRAYAVCATIVAGNVKKRIGRSTKKSVICTRSINS